MRFLMIGLLKAMIEANVTAQVPTESTKGMIMELTTKVVTNSTSEIIDEESFPEMKLLNYFLAVFICVLTVVSFFCILKYKSRGKPKPAPFHISA